MRKLEKEMYYNLEAILELQEIVRKGKEAEQKLEEAESSLEITTRKWLDSKDMKGKIITGGMMLNE